MQDDWREALEAAHASAPWAEWVARDPLSFVRRYQDPMDQEIAGIVAASLAYGRVGSILPSVGRVLDAMENAPRRFVEEFEPERDAARFAACIHRFHTPDAIVAMLSALQAAVERHGSLGAMFLAGYDDRAVDTSDALTRFVERLRGYTSEIADEKALYGWRHFLASPADGSACKRLHLYLRWMVRSGTPDVGAWPQISPAHLLVPVDVHVARVARRMGWSRRAAADRRMSEEITAALRLADPKDPTRFDFVLSHSGMEGTGLSAGG
jgi:uncharacterized protein (TIGR02757 family)